MTNRTFPEGSVFYEERLFTQDGPGTYKATWDLPENAVIQDVIYYGLNWTGTSVFNGATPEPTFDSDRYGIHLSSLTILLTSGDNLSPLNESTVSPTLILQDTVVTASITTDRKGPGTLVIGIYWTLSFDQAKAVKV